jgi:hypothetical protein
MIHGMNPSAAQLLQLLGTHHIEFGRLRDVYVKDGYIVVHTRCGGGNREDYEYVFDQSAQHPWYSHDEDCDFDCTYADIYFKIPDDETKSLVGVLDQGADPAAKWEEIYKALKA